MNKNIECLEERNFVFELTDIGEDFLTHKDPIKILGKDGSSAFLGGLYSKDNIYGLYGSNVIELTLIFDNFKYILYVDTPQGSFEVDKSDYSKERLKEICEYYDYLLY